MSFRSQTHFILLSHFILFFYLLISTEYFLDQQIADANRGGSIFYYFNLDKLEYYRNEDIIH